MPRSLLWFALLCHVVFATGYAWCTPSFEGPDENSHYEYAWQMGNAGRQPLAGALVRARNLPSIFNYRRLGFRQEGIFREAALDAEGAATDLITFALLAREWRKPREWQEP